STITTASAIRTQYEDLGNLMHRESSGRDASLSTSGHVQVRRDERVRLRVSAIEGYAESRDRVPRHVRVRKRSPLRRLGESREGGRAGRPLLPSALWTLALLREHELLRLRVQVVDAETPRAGLHLERLEALAGP